MVKGHQNSPDQHLNQYPTAIYPAQTPYNTRQNQSIVTNGHLIVHHPLTTQPLLPPSAQSHKPLQNSNTINGKGIFKTHD